MATSISFLQENNDTVNRTVYTFSGESLGATAADRLIICAVTGRDTGTITTLDSVTIGGVTATRVAMQTNTAGGNITFLAFYIAAVPSGATGEVVVTFSEDILRCHIGLYRVTGTDINAYDTASSIAANPSMSVDVPANGFVVAVFVASIGTSWTLVGVTERYDTQVETFLTVAGGEGAYSTRQTGLTVSGSHPGSGADIGLCVSWGGRVVSSLVGSGGLVGDGGLVGPGGGLVA